MLDGLRQGLVRTTLCFGCVLKLESRHVLVNNIHENVEVNQGGPQFYVEEFAGDGFFKKPKSIAEVRTELSNRGHHIPVTSLSGPLQILCQRKVFRRQRIANGKKKQTFAYSNW